MSNLSQFGCCNNIPSSTILIEFLLVGGGGGQAGAEVSTYPGPGGAGAMVEAYNFAVIKGQTYPITIGVGGLAGSAAGAGGPGTSGGSSVFANIIAGGGGGGGSGPETVGQPGTFNGSGGGGFGFSASAGPSQYALVSNYFDKIQVIHSFATPSRGLGAYNTQQAFDGGTADGTGNGRLNDITGSNLPYSGSNMIGKDGRGHGGRAGVSGGNGVGGRFAVRWPTAYPDATSVSGNLPVPGTAGYYTYSWNSPGSITF